MTSPKSYHHGDLASALVRAATELLEEDGGAGLSLRAAARRAGVSTAAPYRHFADREALVSAVAAVGYRELAQALIDTHADPHTHSDLIDLAVTYVRFALDRPGLFRAMFAEPCDPTSTDRTAAAAAIGSYLESVVAKAMPDADPQAAATATWALVHGLAFLHLDGKFDASSNSDVEARVRAAVSAVLH